MSSSIVSIDAEHRHVMDGFPYATFSGNAPAPGAPWPPLSRFSSAAPTSAFIYSADLLLRAGMLIVQPETSKVVVIHHPPSGIWFLPKGRKDVGETLEQTALREVYEETGYRAAFLPFYQEHRQPLPGGMVSATTAQASQRLRTTEPFYVHIETYHPGVPVQGHVYIQSFWLGQIPLNAMSAGISLSLCSPTNVRDGVLRGQIRTLGTQMEEETDYHVHLLDPEVAIAKMKGTLHGPILEVGWAAWQQSLKWEADFESRDEGGSH